MANLEGNYQLEMVLILIIFLIGIFLNLSLMTIELIIWKKGLKNLRRLKHLI